MTREEKKKAPSSTPLRDIMEKDEAWENSLSRTDRLALAYLRLAPFYGWWDGEALGPRPSRIGADHRYALLDIVGKAEISRFEKMEIYDWTYDQWLRWYTVERVAENRAAELERLEQLRRERRRERRRDWAAQLLAGLLVFAVFIAAALIAAR